MADIAASVLAPAVESALKSVGAIIKCQFIYLFCFASNIAGLEDEAKQLDDAIQGVQNKVDHEVTNNAREIHNEVTSWFQASDDLISEKNKIINEVPNVKGGCLKLASRFSLSRRAKNTTEAMAQLRQKSKSVEISQPPSAAATKEIPSVNTLSFDSRKEIEQDIMNTLRDKKENMIAIHGMGGLGKTTMAIKVMNALLKEKVFDEIVIAVVSPKIDELKIQLDIGGSLGLNDLKAESARQDRVRKLHDRLSASTTRTLLLLDDVWEELKLENLGIPRGSEGCTILITSRNSDALREMGVKNSFEMEKLSEKDAWLMFSEKAGTCVDDKNLRSIAEEVAKECSGLPIALETLGASLQNEKSKSIWKYTLNMLKRPNPENTAPHIEKAYKPLKISYEKLDENVKSPFLLCCLFPEDVNISVEQMTYFCMGLRLFKDLGSLEDAKGKMSLVVKTLKDRSLLLDGRNKNYVRMHDVVRDVCIFIAKQKEYIGGKDCSWISHIQQPTGIEPSTVLGFPKLRLLFSDDNEFNIDIFFEGMRELYVLSIENYSWKSLPHTQSLNKLRTLVLDSCDDLETISGVGDLVHLEILICRWCGNIKELPQDIRGLNHLKLLEFTECDNLQSIGRGIISSLVELEELKMVESFDRWDTIGLSELQELTKLTCLEIQIAYPLLVAQEINISSEIERFDIRFGGKSARFPEFSIKNILLQWDEGTCFGYWIENLLKDAESLYLTGKWMNKLDIPNYFPNIRSLELDEFGIKSIETTSMENDGGVATMFPQMDSLKLYDLPHLEDICKGPISSISFQNLKHLVMKRLPALKQLWKSNTVMSLPQLVNINIDHCKMMEQLFVWSEEDENITCAGSSNHDVTKIQGVTFPLLQHISITNCPKMRSIIPTSLNGYGDHSSHLFCQPQKVSFGSLKSLNIEWNPFCHHNNICASFFNQLEELCISKYDGSMSLFVLSIARNLGNLKKLRIKDCDEMVTLIEDDKEEGEAVSGGERNRLFPNLKELGLSGLGKLVTFSNLKNDVELPPLEEVSISRCPNMSNLSLATQTLYTDHINLFKVPFSKNENPSYNLHQTRIFSFVDGLQKLLIDKYQGSTSIFSSSIAESLINLTELRISECRKMVKVIEGGERSSTLLFPKLRILELSFLFKLEIFCECESDIELPLLEKLKIIRCPNITKFTLGSISSNSFQNLKHLQLYDLSALKQLWKSNSTVMSLPQLEDIEISHCEKMEQMFVWSEEDENITSAGSSNHVVTKTQGVTFPLLQDISIKECPKMRSIVPTSLNGYGDHSSHLFCQPQKVSFGSLKSLDIEWNPFCHHLKVPFSKNENPSYNPHQTRIFSFVDGLQKLSIKKYQGSTSIFSSSIAESLVNLTELRISACRNMVKVIEGGERSSTLLFPKLRILELSTLLELEIFCESDVELPLLEKLEIIDCPNITKFTLGSISSNSFQNLKHLRMYRLPALKQLWKSNSTVMSLPQLEDIDIYNCEMMEQLFVWSEEDENVTNGGSSNHVVTKTQGVTFPLLRHISIQRCPKMRSIVPTSLNGYGDHSSHLFCQPQKVSFGSLKSLVIEWNPFCRHNNICASFFNQLEKLRISKYDGSMSLFVLSVARNLGNLKELRIEDCDEMVTLIEDDNEEGEAVSGGERIRLFPNLQELGLSGLGKLVTFSNLKNDVELPPLKKVLISRFPNISNLSLATQTLETVHINFFKVPFSKNENPSYNLHQTRIFSFVDGLQKLSIEEYQGSTSIFSSSIAENLVNLSELCISACYKMVKVIEGGERSSTLLFPKLRILELNFLSQLAIFCECESDVELPLLEELEINECPNFIKFSLESVTAPCLKFVEIDGIKCEVDASTDLNGALAFAKEKVKHELAEWMKSIRGE